MDKVVFLRSHSPSIIEKPGIQSVLYSHMIVLRETADLFVFVVKVPGDVKDIRMSDYVHNTVTDITESKRDITISVNPYFRLQNEI